MQLRGTSIVDWSQCVRTDTRLAPSRWETSLQSNAVSHWLGANLESALVCHQTKRRRCRCVFTLEYVSFRTFIACLKIISDSRNGQVLKKWQVVTLPNDDGDQWCIVMSLLTHPSLNKMATILQTIFTSAEWWRLCFHPCWMVGQLVSLPICLFVC